MELIVISGTSGSGKSIALKALEDHDFYCIDNLPVALIEPFIAHCITSGHGTSRPCRAAIGIDIRTLHHDTQSFRSAFHQLQQDYSLILIFLDANDAVLIKRYSESRRRHPLSDDNTSLEEAISQERLLLQPLLQMAHHQFDTSSTSVYQLRHMVIKAAGQVEGKQMAIMFGSFGFKFGIPQEADFVFDVRCLINPHWEAKLRPLTGRDRPVSDYLQQNSDVEQMFNDICHFIQQWIPRFAQDRRSYLTIAIGCTGGQHRSVYMAERLADHFRQGDYPVQLHHRELE
ncbi:RNase adapter RapZ [Ectothiorhodospiraceae bacterium BW-2]|nr:RNase adapter RapZ [Ectothiorhodospiraceae bacterium BW-2]